MLHESFHHGGWRQACDEHCFGLRHTRAKEGFRTIKRRDEREFRESIAHAFVRFSRICIISDSTGSSLASRSVLHGILSTSSIIRLRIPCVQRDMEMVSTTRTNGTVTIVARRGDAVPFTCGIASLGGVSAACCPTTEARFFLWGLTAVGAFGEPSPEVWRPSICTVARGEAGGVSWGSGFFATALLGGSPREEFAFLTPGGIDMVA